MELERADAERVWAAFDQEAIRLWCYQLPGMSLGTPGHPGPEIDDVVALVREAWIAGFLRAFLSG